MIYVILTYLFWFMFIVGWFSLQAYILFNDIEFAADKKNIPEDKSHIKTKEYMSFKRKITEEEKK